MGYKLLDRKSCIAKVTGKESKTDTNLYLILGAVALGFLLFGGKK